MSDYLWDKSGEADPEVERLERLLGTLRHRPEAVELPPAAAPRPGGARPQLFLPARLFRPAALAAAALALAALAGALLMLRDARRGEGQTSAAVNARASAPSAAVPTANSPAAGRETAARAGGPAHEISTDAHGHGVAAGVSSQRRAGVVPARGARAGGPRPRTRAGVGPDGAAVAVSARPEVSRAEAKEQLLYALRLASVKLEEVRRLTSGREGNEAGAGPEGRTR